MARSADRLHEWVCHIDEVQLAPWVRKVLRAYARREYLIDHHNLVVSRPLRDVRIELGGMSKEAVLKALRQANGAGVWDVASRGVHGRTAEYRLTFKTGFEVGELGEPIHVEMTRSWLVHPHDYREFPGSPQYYGQPRDEVCDYDTSTGMPSIFTEPQERESFSHFSLPVDREEGEVHTCRTCGGPLDERSIRAEMAVGDCCAVIAQLVVDDNHARGESA